MQPVPCWLLHSVSASLHPSRHAREAQAAAQQLLPDGRTIMRRRSRRLRPLSESLQPTWAARVLPACTPAEGSRN
jgi:hypothetical protein